VIQSRFALPRGLAALRLGNAGELFRPDRSLSGPDPSFVSRPIAPSAGLNSRPVTKRDRLPGGQVAAFSIESSVSHPRPPPLRVHAAGQRRVACRSPVRRKTLIFTRLRPRRQCRLIDSPPYPSGLSRHGGHDMMEGADQQRCPSRSSTYTTTHSGVVSVPSTRPATPQGNRNLEIRLSRVARTR
jgi:hypothetical protein